MLLKYVSIHYLSFEYTPYNDMQPKLLTSRHSLVDFEPSIFPLKFSDFIIAFADFIFHSVHFPRSFRASCLVKYAIQLDLYCLSRYSVCMSVNGDFRPGRRGPGIDSNSVAASELMDGGFFLLCIAFGGEERAMMLEVSPDIMKADTTRSRGSDEQSSDAAL